VLAIAIVVPYGGVGLASLAVRFWQIGDHQLEQLGTIGRAAGCNMGTCVP